MMLKMITSESGTTRYARRQVRKKREILVVPPRFKPQIMAEFVHCKLQRLIHKTADEVGSQANGPPVKMGACVSHTELK